MLKCVHDNNILDKLGLAPHTLLYKMSSKEDVAVLMQMTAVYVFHPIMPIKACFCYSFLIPFRHGERIGFSYLVSQKYTGDYALVKVLRDSEVLEFNIGLAAHKRLIPAHIKGRPPSYFIIAGFVFTMVSVPYLRSEVCI